MRPLTRNVLLILALSFELAGARSSSAASVTCGDVVPRGMIGELAGDLNCAGPGLVLENGAVLKLNGHTITGPGAPPSGCLLPLCGGVWCQGSRCTVEGPGEVTGFARGIWSQHPTRLSGKGTVVATDVVLRGNSIGVSARTARLTGVTARENSAGIVADRMSLVDVEASANTGEGIIGRRAEGDGLRVEGNAGGFGGIAVESVKLKNAIVRGNGADGIHAQRRIALFDSVVTENGGADLSSLVRPRLSSTTCGSSSDLAGGDWDVCAND